MTDGDETYPAYGLSAMSGAPKVIALALIIGAVIILTASYWYSVIVAVAIAFGFYVAVLITFIALEVERIND